jgi:hypothetical protein
VEIKGGYKMKDLIVTWPKNACYFEKEQARECLKRFNHAEYLQKKLNEINGEMKVKLMDSETCEIEDIFCTEAKWIETPESSNIAKFRMDGSTLSVVFKAGTQYLYYDVPEEIYDGMRTAESKGKYFNANVKGQFVSEKVE